MAPERRSPDQSQSSQDLNIDRLIERLLAVKDTLPGKGVQCAESEVVGLNIL